MKRNIVVLSAAIIAVMICGPTNAASISTAGSSIDTGGTLTSAALGQAIQGTLFWDYSNGSTGIIGTDDGAVDNGGVTAADRVVVDVTGVARDNLPGTVSFGPGTAITAPGAGNRGGASGGWGYQQVIDDNGGLFETGVLAHAAGGGELATLTTSGGLTEMRLGVYTDNLDGTGWNPTVLEVSSDGGSAAVDASALQGTGQDGDVHWFDISGLSDGDVISISATAAPNGNGAIGGLIVARIPEPASLALLGLALGGIAMSCRQR